VHPENDAAVVVFAAVAERDELAFIISRQLHLSLLGIPSRINPER
jgi:hypothetical protein